MFKKATLSAAAVLWALFLFVGCGDKTTANNATPVSITTTTLPTGSVGVAYSSSITATGGTAPYTFSLTSGSLPGGLTLTKAGAITGTPTGSGTFTMNISVADSKGQPATGAVTITIGLGISITTATLPNGTVGTAYSATISAANGTTPYTFAVSAGALPSGLTLSSGGVLAGTPTTPGTFGFSITATDAHSGASTKAYSVTIAPLVPITVSPTTLPGGTVNVAYNQTLIAANGIGPYTYSITVGALPGGLTLSPAGLLSGTPTTANTFTFTVTATDSALRTGTQAYSVTIAAAPVITLSPTTLSNGAVGSAYSVTLSATNGATPYTYAVTQGALPNGLNLATNGLLSGTPTASGPFSFTVTATDKNSQTGSQAYTLTIATAGTTINLANANFGALVNASFTSSLSFSGGTGPYTVTITGGNLPGTISLSPSGVFSGSASTTGSSTITIHVADSSTPQSTQNFTVTVNVVNSTVAVTTSSTLATVPSNFYGLHTAIYDAQLSDTATVSTMMANAGVNTLRYPGGGLADVYHWAQHSVSPYNASFPQNCSELPDAFIASNTHFGTFVQLLRASGAQPIITVNYGTSVANSTASKTTGFDSSNNSNSYCSNPNQPGQPQEAAAWVAYANGSTTDTHMIGVDSAGFDWKTTGYWASMRAASPLATDDGYNFLRLGLTSPLGIKYWEIGNEVYYNGWSGPSPETDTHAPYVYPSGFTPGSYSSRQGVSTLSPSSYAANAMQYSSAMKAVDPTIKIGLDYDLPGTTDPIVVDYNNELTQAACSTGSFDFAITHYYPGSYFGGAQPGELLSLPQSDLPADVVSGGTSSGTSYKGIKQLLQQYCSNASSVQLLMTETSPNNSLATGFPAPVIGLFVMHEMMESLSLGYQNFDWLELHASTTQTNYMDNTFLDSGENPGPSYYGFQMSHMLAAPGDALVSSAATPVSTASTGIISWATLKQDGRKGVVLINADPTQSLTVQVTFAGAALGATATQYSYGVNALYTGTQLPGTPFTIPGQSFPVTVPAYTAVELLIQ